MKKLVILLIFSQFSFGCILFKESDLDPESDLGFLLTLNKILEYNRGYEWKWNYKFIDPNDVGESTFHRVSKIDRDGLLPIPINDNPQGAHIGTFASNVDTISEIYFPELGRFRIDNYDNSNNYLSSIVIDLISSQQTQVEIIQSNITLPFKEETIGVERITKRDYEPYIFFEGGGGNLGFFRGRYYYDFLIVFNRDIYISSTQTNLKFYPILISTTDGENWETIEFYDLVTELTSTTGGNVSLGIPFTIGEDIYFPAKKELVSGVEEAYLVKIPSSNRNNLTYFRIANRNAGFDQINTERMFYFLNQLIYQETDFTGTNSAQYFRDSNFLQSGSTNTPLNTNNTIEITGNYPIFFDDFILNSNQSSQTYYSTDSSFNDFSNTIQHSSPLAGASSYVVFGTKFKQFLFEASTTDYRVSVNSNTPNAQASTIYTFSSSLASGTIQPSSSANFNGYTNDDTKSYFNVNVNESFKYFEVDLSTNNVREFNQPNQFFPSSEFQESICEINSQYNSGSMVISNGKYICIKEPVRSLINPPNTSYNDFRKIVSTSNEGITWSEWKLLPISPQIIK